jgi:hypothetical protein
MNSIKLLTHVSFEDFFAFVYSNIPEKARTRDGKQNIADSICTEFESDSDQVIHCSLDDYTFKREMFEDEHWFWVSEFFKAHPACGKAVKFVWYK